MRPTKKSRIGERTMLACVACKQRKLKCDGVSPKCENCQKNSRECLVEDPATGLHRPRNYMQLLEGRVNYLEDLLHRLHPELQFGCNVSGLDTGQIGQSGNAATPGSAWPADNNFPSTSGGYETSSNGPGSPNVDHLSSEVALLCLSAAGPEPRYFGPSSAVSFSHIASQTMGLRTPMQSTPGSKARMPASAKSQTAKHALPSWPSVEQAEDLTEAFFHNVHAQFPFLHRPTLKKWEQECRRSRSPGGVTELGDVPVFFVLMVYATGSLVSKHIDTAAAEKYYIAAMEYLGPVLEQDGMESIQALLAIAVYSVRSPLGVSLWKVSGMALRLCVQLGYHRSVEKYRRSGDAITKEMSKRCFWAAYTFDRYVSSILGLPGGISDLAIDVELPFDINDEELTSAGIVLAADRTSPTTMTGAIHTIKLRQIWSKFSTHLFPTSSLCSHDNHGDSGPTIEELRQELEDWRATAPVVVDPPLDSPLSVFASIGWFQLAYNHSILLLYRHYIMDTKPYKCSPPLPKTPDIVNRAFEECFAKAQDQCLLYRRMYQNPSIQFTWGSLHMLFFSGLTYLYCLWRSKPIRDAAKQRDVVNTCMACQTVLVIIAERWKLATSYRDLFETLSDRTISMMCGDLVPETTLPRSSSPEADTVEQERVLPSQDWTNNFDGLDIPPESEWMVSELFQTAQGLDPTEWDDITNIDVDFSFQPDAFHHPAMWNNAGVL